MEKSKIKAFYQERALDWFLSPCMHFGRDPLSKLYNLRERHRLFESQLYTCGLAEHSPKKYDTVVLQPSNRIGPSRACLS